ncbi:MAG: hypothetical protein H7Z41_08335 [Cytophagales bacterium]|nr:hypothetical protein [Armatimonadota bacterium]
MKVSGWYHGFAAAMVLFLFCSTIRAEGMREQPVLDADSARQITAYTRDILRTGGDASRARPSLLLLVEKNAAADLTDNLSGALRDADSYTALAATLEDVLGTASERERPFVRFNLARVHLIRAGYAGTARGRSALLARASFAADALRNGTRDPAADGLRGDIESARGNVGAAIAAYQRMVSSGGSKSDAQYRIGAAYARARRYGLAEQALISAARSVGSDGIADPALAYRAYQELALIYLLQGNTPEAARALRQSVAKLGTELPRGVVLRLDVAQQLLVRGGYARDVIAYLETAARLFPRDENTQNLLAQARTLRR